MMKIFIYGPPGSGKTSVGKTLALNLNCNFVDLDELIVDRAGLSIPDIFEQRGEAGFRDLESNLLGEVAHGIQPAVIALGGGALLREANRTVVDRCGCVICLQAGITDILNRLRSDQNKRPLLDGDLEARLQALLQQRQAHYASFPIQVDTARRQPVEVAWEAQVQCGLFRVRGMGEGYDVRIEPEALNRLGETLQNVGVQGPLAVVSDTHVAELYMQRVLEALSRQGYRAAAITFPAGEANKNIQTALSLWTQFLQNGLERRSAILALGGGVVGDLAGFAASTYLRGVDWVNLPTSLLAMVDAGLGGKTGIDLPQGKNLVGAFHAPRLVLVDPQVMATLPEREQRNGLAEVVKHGIIADPKLFNLCANGWEKVNASWDEIIRRALAVKVRVIEDDPYEKGFRQALNLGHTVGHGIELASDYRLLHGEAVAIGMVVEARIAEGMGLARTGLADAIAAVLSGLGLPTRIPPEINREIVLNAIQLDKKKTVGKVRFALPVDIGDVHIGVEVENIGRYLE